MDGTNGGSLSFRSTAKTLLAMRMMQVVISSETNVLLATINVRAIVGGESQLLNALTRSQRLTDEAIAM